MVQGLATASDKLTADFGSWKTPWGEINRFQRLTGDIVQPFNDAGPSIPVEFTSATWGSLASFGARAYPGTKKWYGTSGNSFVAVVEFGDKVRAKAVTAGGESGHVSSPHFDDQAKRYSTGDLRDVYFYRADVKGHAARHHPGGRFPNVGMPALHFRKDAAIALHFAAGHDAAAADSAGSLRRGWRGWLLLAADGVACIIVWETKCRCLLRWVGRDAGGGAVP